jgi:hypothetical protein
VILTASILSTRVTWQETNVKPPWWRHMNVETYRSIYYIKRYCCDINCAFVGYNKNKLVFVTWFDSVSHGEIHFSSEPWFRLKLLTHMFLYAIWFGLVCFRGLVSSIGLLGNVCLCSTHWTYGASLFTCACKSSWQIAPYVCISYYLVMI